MKRFLVVFSMMMLLTACATTGSEVPVSHEEEARTVMVSDMDSIRTTISVNGRLCTLTLSSVTGEKSLMVEDGKRYRTYDLTEIESASDSRRYLFSTAGNINIIISGRTIYLSIGMDWTETVFERDHLSPFIFATHA